VNNTTDFVKGVMFTNSNCRNFIPVNDFKMTNKIIIDPSKEIGRKISYMEGYPLYPFFKKIFDEHIRNMNASADHLLESINSDKYNPEDKKIRD